MNSYENQTDGYHLDDDAYSTGGDSGFSVGKMEDDEDSIQSNKEETTTESPNFLSRIASIPIIQDSFWSAHQLVLQNHAAKKALDYAETRLQNVLATTQPYFSQSSVISKANQIGNKSLDLIERQFPIIVRPTDELIDPIKDRIEHTVSGLQEKKSNMINPRINYIAEQFECMMDLYLPESTDTLESDDKEGVGRLLNAINNLSIRTSKMISEKMSATAEEEKQVKKVVKAWIIQQVTDHQPLKDSIQAKIGPSIQVFYEFTQAELEKFRQELFNTNISHTDRVRNILALSQTDIFMPLYSQAGEYWRLQKK